MAQINGAAYKFSPENSLGKLFLDLGIKDIALGTVQGYRSLSGA